MNHISIKSSRLARLDVKRVLIKDVAYLYSKGYWLTSPNSFTNGVCKILFENTTRIILFCRGDEVGIYTKVKHIFNRK